MQSVRLEWTSSGSSCRYLGSSGCSRHCHLKRRRFGHRCRRGHSPQPNIPPVHLLRERCRSGLRALVRVRTRSANILTVQEVISGCPWAPAAVGATSITAAISKERARTQNVSFPPDQTWTTRRGPFARTWPPTVAMSCDHRNTVHHLFITWELSHLHLCPLRYK